MIDAMVAGLTAFNGMVLVYFGAINGMYGLTGALAIRHMSRYVPGLRTFSTLEPTTVVAAPPITVLAPAYNEAPTCVGAVQSLLALDYPEFEIVVVNDGSTDETLSRLKSAFDLVPGVRAPTSTIPTARISGLYKSRLHPNLWVIDKENGGKADALNAGINYGLTPLFCAMDADSLLERSALIRLVRPFLEDAKTVAAGGMIRIVNDCTLEAGVVTQVRLPKSILARFQVLEYLRAFLLGRVGWASMEASLVISGAFGLFQRSIVVAAGGYASRFSGQETVGEDMELVIRLKRYCHEQAIPCAVSFVPDAVAWTEAPEDLRTLGRQRDRWQRGMYESTTRHRRLLLNPRYGLTGMLAFPHFFILEMIGPLIEFLGYVAFAASVLLGIASPRYMLAFFVMSVVLGVFVSFVAVAVEEFSFSRYKQPRELLELFLLAVVEGFGYRQMTVYWRVRGLWKVVRGTGDWGRMTRKGFGDPPPPAGSTDATELQRESESRSERPGPSGSKRGVAVGAGP